MIVDMEHAKCKCGSLGVRRCDRCHTFPSHEYAPKYRAVSTGVGSWGVIDAVESTSTVPHYVGMMMTERAAKLLAEAMNAVGE